MKKLVYIFTFLLMAAGLSSCNAEIKNITTKNLIGTWDLVSDTIVYSDGTETTTKCTSGEYIVITEDSYSVFSGTRETKYPFTYSDPHMMIDGVSLYDVRSLTRTQLVLSSNIVIPFIQTDHLYIYKRR